MHEHMSLIALVKNKMEMTGMFRLQTIKITNNAFKNLCKGFNWLSSHSECLGLKLKLLQSTLFDSRAIC